MHKIVLLSTALSFVTHGYIHGCENVEDDSNQGRFKRPVTTLYLLEKDPHRVANSGKKAKSMIEIYVPEKAVNEEVLHHSFSCYLCSVSGASRHPVERLRNQNK